jgi:hypothetical protein
VVSKIYVADLSLSLSLSFSAWAPMVFELTPNLMTVRAHSASVRAIIRADDPQGVNQLNLLEMILDDNKLKVEHQESSLAVLPLQLQVTQHDREERA